MMNLKSISKIGGLVLIISAVCLLLGCPNTSSPSKPSTVTEGTIEYGDEVFSCKEGYSIFLPSGSKVKVGSFLSCQTKRPIGQAVEYWYINGTKLENSESQYTINHMVKASDFVGGKLKLSVKFKTPETAKLDLGSNIECKTSLKVEIKNTGADIIESEELSLIATNIANGYTVEYWYVNDVKIESSESRKSFSYVPKRSDFVDGQFRVTVKIKEKEKGTLEYGNEIEGYYSSGSEVGEGYSCNFKANLSEGKAVKYWYINDTKLDGIPYPHDRLQYFIKRSDFVDGKIKVSFDTKDAVKGTIEFDNETVRGIARSLKSQSLERELKSGDPINSVDFFNFDAIVPQDKVVENWYINDLKVTDATNTDWWIGVRDIDFIDGKVKIKVVFKDQ